MENQRNNADEVLRDFNAILKNIDFSAYNPQSADFSQALKIGLMWFLLYQKSNLDNSESKNDSTQSEIEPTTDDEISKKIFESKKFLQKFLDTNDTAFSEIACDELKHAKMLIKKAYSRLPSNDEKKKLKLYEDQIAEINLQL